jgi:hypothetical protein
VNSFQKPVAKIEEVGPRYAFHLVIRRLVPPFVYDAGVYVIFACDMQLMAKNDEPDAPIHWGDESDIEKLAHMGYGADECRKNFARGDRVMVYEVGNEILVCDPFVRFSELVPF